MRSARHTIDFAYTRQELDALFRYAHAHDGETGGVTMPDQRRLTSGRSTGDIT
jgi:hypothetical protein